LVGPSTVVGPIGYTTFVSRAVIAGVMCKE
jgi:hypothetical protein